MASDARLLGRAEKWLMDVNHFTLKEVHERLTHGEVASLAALLVEVRDTTSARSGNYVADTTESPRKVTFANGRTVSVADDGSLAVGWAEKVE